VDEMRVQENHFLLGAGMREGSALPQLKRDVL
jgi:hypothetical protein